MSSYMSNQIIIGNLTRDPEMRYTDAGTPVTDFTVAVNKQYTNAAGAKIEDVIWFRVSAWAKQGEVCYQYLKKGSQVLVEGALVYDRKTGGPRVWEGQDGQGRANFELKAVNVRFLDSKAKNGQPACAPANNDDGGSFAPESGEDIPF